jgi:phage-related protein
MPTVGKGVEEIRVRSEAGAFRVIYIARLPEAIYVLHAFKKTTEKTEQADIDLAAKRLRELLKDRK